MILDGGVNLRDDDAAVIQQLTIMQRDEYQLFRTPNHTLPEYVAAHQQAGDLELVNDQPKAPEAPTYMEYHARGKRSTVPAK